MNADLLRLCRPHRFETDRRVINLARIRGHCDRPKWWPGSAILGLDRDRAAQRVDRLKQLATNVDREIVALREEGIHNGQALGGRVRVDELVDPCRHEEDASVGLHPFDSLECPLQIGEGEFPLARPVEERQAARDPLLGRLLWIEEAGEVALFGRDARFRCGSLIAVLGDVALAETLDCLTGGWVSRSQKCRRGEEAILDAWL